MNNIKDMVSSEQLDILVSNNIQEKIGERIMRIGRNKKNNYMTATQEVEVQGNDKLIIYRDEQELGLNQVELILEPNKIDQLGSECRLTFDEFLNIMNEIADEEEEDWSSLRMKDMININRDKIIEATIIKYAEKEFDLKIDQFSGREVSYNKRYDKDGNFIGETFIVTLTRIPGMRY